LWSLAIEAGTHMLVGCGRYCLQTSAIGGVVVEVGGQTVSLDENEVFCFTATTVSELFVVSQEVDVVQHPCPTANESHDRDFGALFHHCRPFVKVRTDNLEILAWNAKLVTASFSSMMRLLQKQRSSFGWSNQSGDATEVWVKR
jgi:hypothetical protein